MLGHIHWHGSACEWEPAGRVILLLPNFALSYTCMCMWRPIFQSGTFKVCSAKRSWKMEAMFPCIISLMPRQVFLLRNILLKPISQRAIKKFPRRKIVIQWTYLAVLFQS